MSFPTVLMPVFESLQPDVQVRVMRDYERRRKSKTFAYFAWLFLAGIISICVEWDCSLYFGCSVSYS